MNSRLTDLEAIRSDALTCLKAVAPTLCSLADSFQREGKLPRNIWKEMDRPLPPGDDSLGSAFELWHAILRAEQALRSTKPDDRMPNLDKAQQDLRVKLTHVTEQWTEDLVSRLTRDNIYGTLNPFSCAAVLRSEVFPERSEATPSYLAGYVLCTDLQFARERALSSSSHGVRDRTPRLAGVAQSVHSLMLYVEHLEARHVHFQRIADEISATTKTLANLTDLPTTLSGWEDAVDASVRKACVVIGQASEQCRWLMLTTRSFFTSLDDGCSGLSSSGRSINKIDAPWLLFPSATRTIENSNTQGQRAAYSKANEWQKRLEKATSTIAGQLDNLFKSGTPDPCLSYIDAAARELLILHLGETRNLGGIPSIGDSARFQFVVNLLDCFLSQPFSERLRTGSGALRKHSERAVKKNLRNLLKRYGVSLDEGETEPGVLVCKLGEAQIGRNIRYWWRCKAKACDRWWLDQRNESFKTTNTFCSDIAVAQKDPDKLRQAFADAARAYRDSALAIRSKLKDLTHWCNARGREILLIGETGSGSVDPNELISALWIADRLGEPWGNEHEDAAVRVIQRLQRPDGGFDAVDPLYQYRGFLFYPSSSQTISSLARFVTRGGANIREPRVRDRLRRWEEVLSSGIRFLEKQMVKGKEGQESGWHSDRHREADRIDCAETAEAVTALCRAVDAYTSLLNMEATTGLSVTWTDTRASKATATDCGKRHEQLLLTVTTAIRDLRRRTWRYSPLWRDLAKAQKATRSLLFFGPPGTGKTFFQELIAGELKWPLVTITIGDFLANGEDKVVATTVEIFEKLNHLSHACIVFDEFDEMVVDRKKSGGRAHTGFDLLTPALLPLLAGLRSHAETRHCFVSFTTNYRERVDSAASRVGRVDHPVFLNYCDPGARLLLWINARKAGTTLKNKHDVATVLRRSSLCAIDEMTSYMKACSDGLQRPHDFPRAAVDPGFYSYRGGDLVKEEARRVLESVGADYAGGELFCDEKQRTKWLAIVHGQGVSQTPPA